MAAPYQLKAIDQPAELLFFPSPPNKCMLSTEVLKEHPNIFLMLWEFGHKDFYVYLMHQAVDVYGIF